MQKLQSFMTVSIMRGKFSLAGRKCLKVSYRGQRGVPEEGPRVRDFHLGCTIAHGYYDEGFCQ